MKIFEVEAGYLESLRGIATPERGASAAVMETDPVTGQLRPLPPAGKISDVTGVPRTVDVRQASDQRYTFAAGPGPRSRRFRRPTRGGRDRRERRTATNRERRLHGGLKLARDRAATRLMLNVKIIKK